MLLGGGVGPVDGQGVVLAAAEANVGGDGLGVAGQGDVGDQEPDEAFAFTHRGGGVVPDGGEVPGQGADTPALLVVQDVAGVGGCSLIGVLGGVSWAAPSSRSALFQSASRVSATI